MGGARLLLLLAVLAALSGCARPSSDGPVDPATAAPRQACSVPEMQALEALYAATGGREWRCGAPGRPCSQVQVPTGVTGAAVVGDGQVGLSWPFGLSTSWSDARGGVKLSVPSCCEWYGIHCSQSSPPSVLSVSLRNNALVGAVPSWSSTEIAQLVALQHLDLSSNALTGPIPESFGSLSALRHLVLFGNRLDGPIPESLSSLPSLEVAP
ncbi:hypothetical protein T484DRAFT_1782822 [Baffinella frigidus]|nr:hypothetical protein T484DRAFT_1782822 [Cryptophyta sp. CCMP2293]